MNNQNPKLDLNKAQTAPDLEAVTFESLPDPETLEKYGQISPELPSQIASTTLQIVNTRIRLESQRASTERITRILGMVVLGLAAIAGLIMGGVITIFTHHMAYMGLCIAVLGVLPLLVNVFLRPKDSSPDSRTSSKS